MNREGGLVCVDSRDVSGNLSFDHSAFRLNGCGSAARLGRVVEDSRVRAPGLGFVSPPSTFLFPHESNQSSGPCNVDPVYETSIGECYRNSLVMAHVSHSNGKAAERSFDYKWRELCNCTEELGAESSSYDVNPEPADASQIQQDFVSYESTEMKSSWTSDRIDETGSSSDLEPETSSFVRSNHRHPRTFPPPLPSLANEHSLLRSFKSNGRFVLRRVEMPSKSCFRATRRDGRLKLQLVSPAPSWDDDKEDGYVPEEEGVGEAVTRMDEKGIAIKSSPSLKYSHVQLLNSGFPPCFYPITTCSTRRTALTPETKPFLHGYRNGIVSEEDARLISTCKELPPAWQLPLVGSQRPSPNTNVSDRLTYPNNCSNQAIALEVQHGLAILKLLPFNLLFLHFQRCKDGFKINGVYCFKDVELQAKKGCMIESVLDDRFGDFSNCGGKGESLSFQMQGCRSQSTDEKVGFEPLGRNFFTNEKVRDDDPQFPVGADGGISSFARFFQSQLTLYVS